MISYIYKIWFSSLFHLTQNPLFRFLYVPHKPRFNVDVLFIDWNKNEFLPSQGLEQGLA